MGDQMNLMEYSVLGIFLMLGVTALCLLIILFLGDK
jgi:hypothetical protein